MTKETEKLKEKWSLIPSFLKTKGIFNQHIASFNYFVDIDIRNIMHANDKIVSETHSEFYLKLFFLKLFYKIF